MIYRVAAAGLIILCLSIASAGCEVRSDWPMWRGDRQNSGHLPLPGNMNRTPDILWTHFVGGYASQASGLDIDGDGREEIIVLSAGMIRAIDRCGETIWATRPLDLSLILDTVDLGGDGSLDIVASRYSTSTIFVIDSRTGEVTWNHTFPSPSSGLGRHGFKAADISDRFPGEELLVWPYKSSIGYAFGFSSGGVEMIWNATAPETRNYPPPIAVADLDLDGTRELVIATFERIYAFDGETGEPTMYVHSPGINRNYGTMIITNLDDDPYPEIPVLSSNLNEHLWVVDNDGHNLSEIWNVFFEYSYPEDLKQLRITVDSVSDVDSDGNKEIIFSVFDSTADDRWHTRVWDALTGVEELDLVDEYLLTVVDIDGDGVDEIVTSEQHARSVQYYSNVTIWEGGEPGAVMGNCGLIRDSWAPYPDGTNTIADTDTWMRAEDGYLVRANGSIGSLTMHESGIDVEWILNESSIPASLSIRGVYEGTGILASGNDGLLRVFDGSGALVTTCETGGFLPAMIATDIDSDGLPEVLIRNSQGTELILEANGSRSGEFGSSSRRAKFGKDGSFVVWDMEGDGEVEILAAGSSSLDLLDGDGDHVSSYDMPSMPFDWTVGNVTGDDHWDLFVSCLGSGSHTAITMAIDGATGEVLWEKDWGPYAGFFGVMDWDEDGLDDLVVREHFDFYIVIGPTGDERKGKDLCGYHAPIVTDVESDGTTEIVWGGGWGSLSVDRKRKLENKYGIFLYVSQIWVTLFGGGDSNELYGLMPAVADIDGDGIKEIGAGNINGTLHVFDGENGDLEASYHLGSAPSDVVSCDIDHDGLSELLFGTRDGRLISLGSEGFEWEYDFGSSVGDPVLCDLDCDGMADILVPVMDGNVYALHIGEFSAFMAPVLFSLLALLGAVARSRPFQ
jgi:hypothetical protein